VLNAAEEQGARLAIIDTPGKSTDAAIAAAKVANFVLMPIHPQLYDIETLDKAKDILTLAGNPPNSVLINLAPLQGRRHIETQEALTQAGFTVCPTVLYTRVAHGDAGNIGLTAQEYAPRGKAAQEMLALYSYISIALYLKKDRRSEKKHANRRAQIRRRGKGAVERRESAQGENGKDGFNRGAFCPGGTARSVSRAGRAGE
jgi:chromosome partitioning protein